MRSFSILNFYLLCISVIQKLMDIMNTYVIYVIYLTGKRPTYNGRFLPPLPPCFISLPSSLEFTLCSDFCSYMCFVSLFLLLLTVLFPYVFIFYFCYMCVNHQVIYRIILYALHGIILYVAFSRYFLNLTFVRFDHVGTGGPSLFI